MLIVKVIIGEYCVVVTSDFEWLKYMLVQNKRILAKNLVLNYQ